MKEEPVENRGRLLGLLLIVFALTPLFSSLGKPRVATLHGADVPALIIAGACLGVGFVGLLGRLKLRNE